MKEKIERKNKFNWYIYLISLPYNISKIAITYKIIEQISNSIDIDKTDITCKDTQYGWGQHKLKFNNILKFNKLIFKLKITIIDIYDNYGNIINTNNYKEKIKYPPINYYNINNEIKMNEKYIWKINDINIINDIKNANIGESFESKCFQMYGFDQWYLRFYPNGT